MVPPILETRKLSTEKHQLAQKVYLNLGVQLLNLDPELHLRLQGWVLIWEMVELKDIKTQLVSYHHGSFEM